MRKLPEAVGIVGNPLFFPFVLFYILYAKLSDSVPFIENKSHRKDFRIGLNENRAYFSLTQNLDTMNGFIIQHNPYSI